MRNKPTTQRANERGNAFIFILLGVALFAALSFTIARGLRGSTASTLSARDADLAVTEILTYAQKVQRAVDRVRRKGCSENEISFENDIVAGYTNANAPGDNSCHIFHPDGGSISYASPNLEWLDSNQSAQTEYGNIFFTGTTCIINVGNNNGSSTNCDSQGDNEELLFTIPYLKQDLCIKLNDKLDIVNPSGVPTKDLNLSWATTKFTGLLSGALEIGDNDVNGALEIRGKSAGCFEGSINPTPSGSYHFYHVLLAR